MEFKATASPHLEVDVDEPETGTIKVAGLAVKAADTGRLLMIQRALDDDDPAAGTWEFPGGHLDGDEDALAAALREWEEETGSPLPGTISVVGSWTAPNGIYRGFVAVVPTESAIPLNLPHDKRRLTNPDDPKGDAPEVTAWWPITALPDMPLLRPACRETPWSLLAGATLPKAPRRPLKALSRPRSSPRRPWLIPECSAPRKRSRRALPYAPHAAARHASSTSPPAPSSRRSKAVSSPAVRRSPCPTSPCPSPRNSSAPGSTTACASSSARTKGRGCASWAPTRTTPS